MCRGSVLCADVFKSYISPLPSLISSAPKINTLWKCYPVQHWMFINLCSHGLISVNLVKR